MNKKVIKIYRGLDRANVGQRLLQPANASVGGGLVSAIPGEAPLQNQEDDYDEGDHVGRSDKSCRLHLRDQHAHEDSDVEGGVDQPGHWLCQVRPSAHDVLVKHLHDVRHLLLACLPGLLGRAAGRKVQRLLEDHRRQTRGHEVGDVPVHPMKFMVGMVLQI